MLAVAALVATSPISMAATVLHAPYKGGVATSFFAFNSSCAKYSIPRFAQFSLATGKGGLGYDVAHAKACAAFSGSFGPVNAFSQGLAETEVALAIKLHLPGGTHTVTPTVGASWSVGDNYSTPKNCSTPRPFQIQVSYAPPGATYAWWQNYSGTQSLCYAYASVAAWVNSFYIEDLTNGTFIYASSGCPAPSYFCGYYFVTHYNLNEYSYGWEFYNYTTYSNGNWTYSSGVYNLNASLKTTATSFTSTGAATAGFNFTYHYIGTHSYALKLDLVTWTDVDILGWPGGSVSARSNLATLGGGVSLPSIVVR